MLDQETKRKIDTARDILVGKLPNPQSQIEQITIAMIYKFMDDMDKEAIEFGGVPTFFIGDYEKYSWTKIFDPKLGGYEMLTLYGEAIVKLNQNPHIPQLFRDIFKNAYLPYRDPETLKMFLKVINEFTYDHSEKLGDAFEYLLSVLGSQGDAGQFRTPRHIIDFMVEIIQPKKEESICDPACGTAGFLISSYKHIITQNTKNNKGDLLTPDERKKITNNFVGYDISSEMVRLSLVNMYLHGFTSPKIYEYDTLTSTDRWGDTFDIILANPPFMTPKGGIQPHKKFGVQANRAEVLFVDYIASHLKPNGRAGIIVPEGIIFQSGTAYKALRKNLVENQGLVAVISLPSGVFQPYAGVKTSILILDRKLAATKKDILFVKVSNDGFSLNTNRKSIAQNDLPKALEAIKQFQKTDILSEEDAEDFAQLIPKERITNDKEYNLTGDKYRDNIVTNPKYEFVPLSELVDIKTGKKDANQGNPNGKYPFFTCAKENTFSDEYSYDTEAILIAGNGDVGNCKYYKGKFEAYQRTYILDNFRRVLPKFLFAFLNNSLKPVLEKQKLGNTMPYIKMGMLADFEIPLPPLAVQEKIVAEIENKQSAINHAREIIKNLERERAYFDPHPRALRENWPIRKLGEVCTIGDGNHSSNYPKSSEMVESGIPFIRGTNLVDERICDADMKYITPEKHAQLKKGHLITGDVIFVNRGEIGKLAVVDEKHNGSNLNSQNAWLRANPSDILPQYLLRILGSRPVQCEIAQAKTGVTLQQFTIKQIKDIAVPIPSLQIQKEYVAEFKKEQQIIDCSRTLIGLMESKISSTISELWEQ